MQFKDTQYGDLTNQIYNGKIHIYGQNIKSLIGSPKEVIGDYNRSNNSLDYLIFSPLKINGDFDVTYNKLTSLKGSPRIINGDFSCAHNNLTSLEGSPLEVSGDYYCSYNENLSSLKYCTKNIKDSLILEGIKSFNNVVFLKQEIIENQIRAKKYLYSLNKSFTFKEIEEEFNKFSSFLEKKEMKYKNIDYGLSI